MSRRRAPLFCLSIVLGGLAGCYQGEWRLGSEMPMASAHRLVPTRDVERWELQQSMTPNVVQVKGTVTPRCRYVLFGTSSRTDTGRFKRVGTGYWTAAAILAGTAGGAAGGFGGSGWFSQLYPDWGRPAMYGVGGALAAGGLASCISAIASPTKLRLALCGIMVGLGGSVLAGAAISALPGGAGNSTGAGTPASTNQFIDTTTFRNLAIAGGAMVGAAIFSGLISASWRGYIDRERTTEIENAQAWDPQTSEQNCGGQRGISGRTATIEISAENLTEGLGSEGSPLKIRVAMTGQTLQAVDLRSLRNAIPSCGALTVRLSPDLLYEENTIDDYMPPMLPSEMTNNSRPTHGVITPKEGITLPASGGTRKATTGLPRQPVPGISLDVLATLERRCRGDEADPVPPPVVEKRPRTRRPPVRVTPSTEAQSDPPPSSPSDSGTPSEEGNVQRGEPSARPTGDAPSSGSTPSVSSGTLTPSRTPLGQPEVHECSADAQQARFADCEHQCGRALELSACLFDFRKCHINARQSAQPQKERDACDLAWEQCLFKTNVAPGSWRRCVEGCTQANEPAACRGGK